MTGDLILDSAISLAGIAILVLLARLLFRSGTAIVDRAGAQERLTFDEPDFVPRRWFFDESGAAALALGEGGEAALVKRLGGDLVTRRFRPEAAKISREDGELVIALPDHTAPKIRLRLGEEADAAASGLQGGSPPP